MKKILLVILIVFIFSTFSLSSFASINDDDIYINVNGSRVFFDSEPFIKNDRILIPLRGVFEKLGAEVSWDASAKKVLVQYKETQITLRINSIYAYVNNKREKLDARPVIKNGRTMIPLRFISERIGMLVEWVENARLATITDPDYFKNFSQKTVLGFTTNDYKGDNDSHNSLINNSDKINGIATFSYEINGNGSVVLSGEFQKNSIEYALKNNIKPMALIHNYIGAGFNTEIAHQVLSNESKRNKLIDNILTIVSKNGYSGVNIDLENMYSSDKTYYSQFIKSLKEKLSPYGFITTVCVAAKTFDSKDNWTGAFDYTEIGKYADKIVLMTYDEHYFGGTAGPIASSPWIEKVLIYAIDKIPREKILMGLGIYGYDWSKNGTKVVTYKKSNMLFTIPGVVYNFDNNYKTPQITYNKDGVFHNVWYENNLSIQNKLNIVDKYNLGGIAIWKLGYDNEEFWKLIDDYLS